MESKIKELIKKWSRNYRIIQSWENTCEEIEKDLEFLLELYEAEKDKTDI